MNISLSPLPEFLARLRGSPADEEIESTIQTIKDCHALDSFTIAQLATVLANSGLLLQSTKGIGADVASTGGPTSLSTLLTPLLLRVGGAIVPKIGVPGRPAGGIDCLGQIPGYKTTMPMMEAQTILDRIGYVHFLAQGEAAPLDGRMFKIRQRVGAQAVPALVVASLLAKKLAAGINYAGLDIRVAPHGNFGENWSAASENAKLYKNTAEILGITGTPILTDGRYPYQPFLGRRESLIALHDLFEANDTSWLRTHFETCRLLALACAPVEMRSKIANASANEIRQQFEWNLQAQGTTYEAFLKVVSESRAKHDIEIVANADGFCVWPLAALRRLFVQWQNSIRKSDSDTNIFPDPVGMILLQRPGTWVTKGTPLATIRTPITDRATMHHELSRLIATPSQISLGPLFEMIYG